MFIVGNDELAVQRSWSPILNIPHVFRNVLDCHSLRLFTRAGTQRLFEVQVEGDRVFIRCLTSKGSIKSELNTLSHSNKRYSHHPLLRGNSKQSGSNHRCRGPMRNLALRWTVGGRSTYKLAPAMLRDIEMNIVGELIWQEEGRNARQHGRHCPSRTNFPTKIWRPSPHVWWKFFNRLNLFACLPSSHILNRSV